ncbi:MAG: hypothetical protein KDA25_00670 [Phycisphaerales bacterium]|nr:hypothetical protein [Phycisphaerales bacterium]
MKRTLPALAATTAVLAVAMNASAGYTGLATEEMTNAESLGLGIAVIDLYATFSNPADSVLTMTSLGITTTDAAGFWQHPLGGVLAPMDALIPGTPALAYDSFVTAGTHTTIGAPSAFSVDVNASLFNTGGVLTGTWSAMPMSPFAVAGGDLRVLIARLSVTAGESISGTMLVNWKDGVTGAPGIGQPEFFQVATVPAPGAAALLGCAGAFGRRRRRRA